MLEVVPVIGVPASGKTTIFRRLITRLSQSDKPKSLKFGTARGYVFNGSQVIVLGIYDADLFGGTDRLSMAVSPDVEKLIVKLNKNPDFSGWRMTWEGDRLSSHSLFSFIDKQGGLGDVVCVQADPADIERRQKVRSNRQNATWRAGRESKIKNLCDKYNVITLRNSDPEDLEKAVDYLYARLAVSA